MQVQKFLRTQLCSPYAKSGKKGRSIMQKFGQAREISLGRSKEYTLFEKLFKS